MRSSKPIPGNPWPHDMVITVEDRPSALLEMLWIREAHNLHLDGTDFPPLLVDTPPDSSERVDDAEERNRWERALPTLWHWVTEHTGRDQDPRHFQVLQRTANGSPERESILREMLGPSWRDEFGDAAFDDDSYRDWSSRGMDAHLSAMRQGMTPSPEHKNVDALVRAWRAGLTKIVTIPCEGEYSRRIGPNALLLTDATRRDSAAYERALGSIR